MIKLLRQVCRKHLFFLNQFCNVRNQLYLCRVFVEENAKVERLNVRRQRRSGKNKHIDQDKANSWVYMAWCSVDDIGTYLILWASVSVVYVLSLKPCDLRVSFLQNKFQQTDQFFCITLLVNTLFYNILPVIEIQPHDKLLQMLNYFLYILFCINSIILIFLASISNIMILLEYLHVNKKLFLYFDELFELSLKQDHVLTLFGE